MLDFIKQFLQQKEEPELRSYYIKRETPSAVRLGVHGDLAEVIEVIKDGEVETLPGNQHIETMLRAFRKIHGISLTTPSRIKTSKVELTEITVPFGDEKYPLRR
jgi:hypothetical protein